MKVLVIIITVEIQMANQRDPGATLLIDTLNGATVNVHNFAKEIY